MKNFKEKEHKKLFQIYGFKIHELLILVISLLLLCAICVLPFIIMISSSLTDNAIVSKGVVIIPKGWDITAYRILFEFPQQLMTSYGYTIIISVIGTVVNAFLCCMLAYPLADPQFKHRPWVSFLVYFTMLFNAGLIPTYIVVTRLFSLNDTIWILILIPLLQPGHILFFRVYMQSLPMGILESARIDGAGEFKIMTKLAMPLILPGLAAMSFQIFMMYWNDAYTPLYFADNITPVALYLQRWRNYVEYLRVAGASGVGGIIGQTGDIPEATVQYAMGVVSTVPLLAVFVFFQKYFVRGLTAGAIKG